jgi:hypothetical protein
MSLYLKKPQKNIKTDNQTNVLFLQNSLGLNAFLLHFSKSEQYLGRLLGFPPMNCYIECLT